MKYIRLSVTDPYYNLAVEEYLLRNTREEVLMLWQNAPTVVIGKNQNAYAEVDLDYARTHGIRIARRLTGGGAVYHDAGNINYTFITSGASVGYAPFTRPVIDALASLGITAEQSGRNDIEWKGKKISGNAQYVSEGRVLHHGTLLFDTDVETMSAVLRVDKEKVALRAVPSHRGRVACLASALSDISVEQFMDCIERHLLFQTGAIPWALPYDSEIERLRARNASDAWIFSDKRFLTEYTVTRRRRYPFGTLSCDVTFLRDAIASVRLSGDFFGNAPIEELESALVGKTAKTVACLDPSPYITGMTADDLASLLFE